MTIQEAIDRYGNILIVYTGFYHVVPRDVDIAHSIWSAEDFFCEELDLDIDDEYFNGRVIIDTNRGSQHLAYLAHNTRNYVC